MESQSIAGENPAIPTTSMKLNSRNPAEILIMVKPAIMRDVVIHALKQAGYEITGTGQALTSDSTGDIWAVPPTGSHPDEFKPSAQFPHGPTDMSENQP